MVSALQMSVLAVLGGRLAWLQLVNGRRYKMLSDKNRINVKMISPSRGGIFDRNGIALAVNTQNFRVLLVPEQAKDIAGVLTSLQRVIVLNDAQIERVIKRAKRVAKFIPIEVKDKLSWEEVSKIEVNLPDLPGLSIGVGDVRSYPYGGATAHVVGYVGQPSEADLGEDPLFTLPGFRLGKTGFEKRYDRQMRGSAGTKQVEVNVIGREVRELNSQPGAEGKSAALSIDIELQKFVQEKIATQKSATAVVMDAHTGAVYAMASHPGFDPNLFTHGMPADVWEGLLANPGHPLTNKAIAGQYPPASTFKMMTALAGLRAGKINRNRTVYCPGHYEYGTDRFHCWKSSGHGAVNLEEALSQSCDTYFYELSTEIGIEAIAKTARDFGLGRTLDFELREERPGLVPDKAWKMGRFAERWQPGETIVASIGQGYLQTTPLQLAVMTARLVNGGYAVKPWITGYVGDQNLTQGKWPKMSVSAKHLALIKSGMDMVVNSKTGTAKGSKIEDPAYAFGGKTGTAQVRRITKAERAAGDRNEDLPWKQRHHGLFVGYAPYNNPRYVCAVVVEHGGGGSASAAPLAKDILLETQKRAPAKNAIQGIVDGKVAQRTNKQQTKI